MVIPILWIKGKSYDFYHEQYSLNFTIKQAQKEKY